MNFLLFFSITLMTNLFALDINLLLNMPPTSQNTKKRRFSEGHLHGNNQESFGKAHHTKKIASSGKTFAHYTCARCDFGPRCSGSILLHCHNECFPKEGLPCIDCSVSNPAMKEIKFLNFTKMVKHNIRCHSDLHRWRCFACDTDVKQVDFFRHFKSNTHKVSSANMFGNILTQSEYTDFLVKYRNRMKSQRDKSKKLTVPAIAEISRSLNSDIGEKNTRNVAPLANDSINS